MEVWEKFQISAEFLAETHGQISCTTCHGGRDEIVTKQEAHETDEPYRFVADPSTGNAPACSGCHEGITQAHEASVHQTQSGYLTMFKRRIGSEIIPSKIDEMFQTHCASCHTSCGQCHISRPNSVQGGFLGGHEFRRTPSQSNNCTACHGSRVGDEYRGRNEGIQADVHWSPGRMLCFDCHTGMELHGDGTTPETRYEVAQAPQCVDCHEDILTDDDAQHAAHVSESSNNPKLACQVCHSMPYKNCYNCHVGIDERGLEHPSQIDFRIGKNPIVSETRPWDYVLLRHVPIAPTSFDDWEPGVMTAYAAEPTWKYASPHNIRKETPQNASCGACHGNEDLFLTEEYINSLIGEGVMFSDEIEANEGVVVTDLP